jgi:hypothetical protein
MELNTVLRRLIAGVVIPLAACARVTTPASSLPASHAASTVVDRSAAPCTVSYDGAIWYRLPAGDFPPIDVRVAKCGFKVLGRNLSPDRPHWSIPLSATQTRFVFTSLDEVISVNGTRNIERIAAAHHVPVSWMVGDIRHMAYAADYNAFHAANGDDAQAQFWGNLHATMSAKLPWYVPSVSILTAALSHLASMRSGGSPGTVAVPTGRSIMAPHGAPIAPTFIPISGRSRMADARC